MMNFSEIRSKIEHYFSENEFDFSPRELYDPLDYIMGIGGKRLRPVSLLLAYQLFAKNLDRALPAAYAVELFHNFSLIHDDIMDEAPLRRGHTTVHHKWDVNTAILSGDAMLIYSYQFLNNACSANNAIEVFKTFGDTAIMVCEGQQMDVNFETQSTVTKKEYITMIYKKTGALLEGAMKIGALLAGAPASEIMQIGHFAKHIGISFQLQDDILDAFGKSAKVGKQIGGDIIQNKKTILYLLALEHGSEVQKRELTQLFTEKGLDNITKVARTMKIFKDLEIRTKAEQLRDHYHKSAFSSLGQIDASKELKQPIIDFADQLLTRNF